MTRVLAPTILAALALSACGHAPNGERDLVSRDDGIGAVVIETDLIRPATKTWVPGNALPLVTVSMSLSQSRLATQALVAGGRVMPRLSGLSCQIAASWSVWPKSKESCFWWVVQTGRIRWLQVLSERCWGWCRS